MALCTPPDKRRGKWFRTARAINAFIFCVVILLWFNYTELIKNATQAMFMKETLSFSQNQTAAALYGRKTLVFQQKEDEVVPAFAAQQIGPVVVDVDKTTTSRHMQELLGPAFRQDYGNGPNDNDIENDDSKGSKSPETTADRHIPIFVNDENHSAVIEMPSGRLVVQAGNEVVFWYGGMERLCSILQAMKNIYRNTGDYDDDALQEQNSTGSGNRTERPLIQAVQRQHAIMIAAAAAAATAANHKNIIAKMKEPHLQLLPLPSRTELTRLYHDKTSKITPLLNVTATTCKMDTGLGQGNWVTAIYCIRLAAAWFGIDLQFTCLDQNDEISKNRLLVPWFTGYFAAHTQMQALATTTATSNSTNTDAGRITQEHVCTSDYGKIRLDFMCRHIQSDLRRMAIAIVGNRTHAVQGQDHHHHHHDRAIVAAPRTNHHLNKQNNIVLDDVVIHFRCGDVMGGRTRHDYGIIRFDAYKEVIVPTARSVGILTQPFDLQNRDNRDHDRNRTGTCKRATYLLVDYLREHVFQNDTAVRITIHNTANETLPLAYARMVMANQSIISLSTFGVFPMIGTFGHGYFQRGNGGVNPFANYLPSIMPNIHMIDAPKLSTGRIQKWLLDSTRGEDRVMQWLVSKK